ncbi:aspartate racemase/maleate isomerase family protein [Mangrovicoccus ximenensis]|uniref:aspartate racemase/maleate isomerase family protein n=1 Tax=Mangrovicoccus ximenensis TaxID=1911570 RepID=UPI000D371D23|nr:NAD(P)-dependent oxidoreductase [Mangrovicoccus ximenensis]
MKNFPMFLRMDGRRVVICGSGAEAARKARLVLKTEAEIVILGRDLDPELAGLAASGRAVHHPELRPDTFAGAVLAFVATGWGDGVAAAIGGRAPVVTPLSGALRAFAGLGIGRIALMTPYLPQTADLVAGWFAGQGIEVVSELSLGHDDDREMALLPQEELVSAAMRADHPEAGAVFLSCTALPALQAIGEIEERLGKPVVSSNQAAFWAALDIAGIPATGPGSLYRLREEWRSW